jgi:hypothetical protein
MAGSFVAASVFVGIGNPFPNVAGEIEDPVRRRASRKRSHGNGMPRIARAAPFAVEISEVSAAAIEFVSPWVHAPIATPGGLFPLRFGG